jgi:translation initiation factor 1
MSDDDAFVWSSDQGDTRKQNKKKRKSKNKSAAPNSGGVRVQRETKGRRGKTVTVIYGIPEPEAELEALAGELKKRCGTGGSVKDGTVVIQGDQADQIVAYLNEQGYDAKRSGG